jgi:hypothetical protein
LESAGLSLTGDQQLVLQAVCAWFRAHGTWPTFASIDRPLRRVHSLDTRTVVQSLPDSLVVKPRPATWFAAEDELRLRLRGIYACRGGREDTERFVRLLRWLAEKEMEFEPEHGSAENMPRVTAEEASEHLGLEKDDHVVHQRLYAMLQLDHWGLGGSGSGADGWYVFLSPDIWRFRDVQTVEDCIRARLQWRLEAEAAVPRMRNTTQTSYYHVRVSTKSKPTWDEVKLDLSDDELESRFVTPYREGRPIVINGATIPIDDLKALRINRTDQPSAELRPIVKAEQRTQKSVVLGLPEDWRIADKGADATDQFITEPPGSAAKQATVPPSQPAALPGLPSYVDKQIIDAIRAKDGKIKLNVTKLLALINELNDNYRQTFTYSAHAMLRAILDHIPPILNCPDFKAVANNYSWGQTDKAYMKKLLDFKLNADDALHRQISSKPDLLSLHDLPPRTWINQLLQECADKL